MVLLLREFTRFSLLLFSLLGSANKVISWQHTFIFRCRRDSQTLAQISHFWDFCDISSHFSWQFLEFQVLNIKHKSFIKYIRWPVFFSQVINIKTFNLRCSGFKISLSMGLSLLHVLIDSRLLLNQCGIERFWWTEEDRKEFIKTHKTVCLKSSLIDWESSSWLCRVQEILSENKK